MRRWSFVGAAVLPGSGDRHRRPDCLFAGDAKPGETKRAAPRPLIGVHVRLGACAVPLTGLGGTSGLSMALTIVGCYAIAILLFGLLVAANDA